MVLRTLVNDVIDIFEVNRKECAKILLELPRWVGRNTFKTRATAEKPRTEEGDNNPDEPTEASEWILEHLLLEVRFPVLFVFFLSDHKMTTNHFLVFIP